MSPSSPTSNAPSTPVRKRTRASPEQLKVLEDTFAMTVSPNGRQRKQLSLQLDMPERSIQIWFQNKRAKVKQLQKRAQMMRASQPQLYYQPLLYPSADQGVPSPPLDWSAAYYTASPPLDMLDMNVFSDACLPNLTMPATPPLSPPFQDLYHFVSVPGAGPNPMITASEQCASPSPLGSESPETPQLTIDPSQLMVTPHAALPSQPPVSINVETLSIGQWHRAKDDVHDLRCEYNLDKGVFEWHIIGPSFCYKIELDAASVEWISHLETSTELHMQLSRLPLFFIRKADEQEWTPCQDFTQDRQASKVFMHTLRGNPYQIRNDLLTLQTLNPHLPVSVAVIGRDELLPNDLETLTHTGQAQPFFECIYNNE